MPPEAPQPRALRAHGKAFPHHTSSHLTTPPHPLSEPHHSHPPLPLTLLGPPGQVVAHKLSTPHLCRCYDPAQCDAEQPCEAARAGCTEQLLRDRSFTKLIAPDLIIISSIGAPDTLLPTSIRHVYAMDPNHFRCYDPAQSDDSEPCEAARAKCTKNYFETDPSLNSSGPTSSSSAASAPPTS
jgi:hypothetical protein